MLDLKPKSRACRVKSIGCVCMLLRRGRLCFCCLEGRENVLDPGLEGKGEERERNLPAAGTAGDEREESREQLGTGGRWGGGRG